MASPAVAVSSWFRKPIIPLEGIINSQSIRFPFASMLVISPFRIDTISTALPETSSGRSIVKCSTGSHFGTVDGFDDHLGLANLQFVAFPPHGFY